MFKPILCSIFFIFLFQGCSQKSHVELLQSKEVKIDIRKTPLYIELNNSTNKQINLDKELMQRLEKQLTIIENKMTDESFHLIINIPFASKINHKEAEHNILNNVNINIGVGGKSGNFSIYTQIGSNLAKILSNEFSSELFQMVVNLELHEYQNSKLINTYTMQILATAQIKRNSDETIQEIQEAVVKRITEILIISKEIIPQNDNDF